MSSLATRTLHAAARAKAGPSYTNGIYNRARAIQAAAIANHAVLVGQSVFLQLKAAEIGAFRPRHSIPEASALPDRFLIKVSTPTPTTSPWPTGGPQALIHNASRDLYFTLKPGPCSSGQEKADFSSLMQHVRREGGFARVFWAEKTEDGTALRLLVGEKVDPEVVARAEF